MAESPGFFGAIANHQGALESALARLPRAGQTVPQQLGVHGHVFAIRGSGGRLSPDGSRAWVAGVVASGASDASNGASRAALAAYGQGQAECFQRLDGNFCFAVHEPALGRIRLTADVTGAKSLFFSVEPSMEQPEVIVFGSSAMEVLRAAALPAVASASALQRYLRRGALAGSSETLLNRVYALRRRHYLEIVGAASMQVREVPFPQDEETSATVGTLEDEAQRLRDVLLKSVATHARGAGNVAVACSGGIDSSGILGCLGQVRGIAEPLHIYSYLQRPPAIPAQWDERQWAELAARRAGAQLHSVELDASEVPGLLAAVITTQDFPFGSPVILAQAKLFRVAAENGVDTMLCGHGADLLFGGADIHLALRLAHLVRKGRLIAAARMLPGARAHSAGGTVRLLASTVARVFGFGSPETWRPHSVPWGSTDWFRERISSEPAEPRATGGRLETMSELIERQLGDCLGATSLLYEECNARSHGLETRLPYMVASLAHLSRATPPEYMVSERGEPKYLLRRALRGLVPAEILARSDRVGFAVPVLPWLIQQREWVNDRYARLQSLPFFRGVSTRSLWSELERGSTDAWRRAFHLWRWIVLLEWSDAHNVRFE
jgi:asparagine synthase (glutamine-hydrolysing)